MNAAGNPLLNAPYWLSYRSLNIHDACALDRVRCTCRAKYKLILLFANYCSFIIMFSLFSLQCMYFAMNIFPSGFIFLTNRTDPFKQSWHILNTLMHRKENESHIIRKTII